MSATFDNTGAYRYRLERNNLGGTKTCLFVMLNPSTADAVQDDPTIRRCLSFAKREGAGRLIVCNLYAYRATDPSCLKEVLDPVGLDNEYHIRSAAEESDLIIVAWGASHLGGDWPEKVLRILKSIKPVYALSVTKSGQPGHPLYLSGNSPLILL